MSKTGKELVYPTELGKVMSELLLLLLLLMPAGALTLTFPTHHLLYVKYFRFSSSQLNEKRLRNGYVVSWYRIFPKLFKNGFPLDTACTLTRTANWTAVFVLVYKHRLPCRYDSWWFALFRPVGIGLLPVDLWHQTTTVVIMELTRRLTATTMTSVALLH